MLLLAKSYRCGHHPSAFIWDLTGSVRQASGSNLISSPLPPIPNFFFFPAIFSRHFQPRFCNASAPRADPAQSLVLPLPPRSTGRMLPPPGICPQGINTRGGFSFRPRVKIFSQHNRVEKGAKGQWEVTKYRTYQNMGKFRQVSGDF